MTSMRTCLRSEYTYSIFAPEFRVAQQLAKLPSPTEELAGYNLDEREYIQNNDILDLDIGSSCRKPGLKNVTH